MDDTIVAIATAQGHGAIGIVRLSGKDAIKVAKTMFRRKSGQPADDFRSHAISYGRIVDGDGLIDEVMIAVMQAPRSYTGEDVVEIHCHGNPIIYGKIIDECISRGVRLAEPGEFTKRAFLNGKMDLTQAEAVADIICANSLLSLNIANNHLKGDIKRIIMDLKEDILDVIANLEAILEFPDEELDVVSADSVLINLKESDQLCQKLAESYKLGEKINAGIRAVIVGKPNAGKSSVFNAIIGRDRAIVTAEPGTTRDIVEAQMSADGLQITLVDTAGISGTANSLAANEGMRRSEKAIESADILVFIADVSTQWSTWDENIAALAGKKPGILVSNKCDLTERIDISCARKRLPGWPEIRISALKGTGIDDLKDAIAIRCNGLIPRELGESVIITSIRQNNAIEACSDALKEAMEAVEMEYSEDVVVLELKRAIESLGEITGDFSNEMVLDKIFSRFCIGK